MSKLLIIGAGQYGYLTKDIAIDMNCFERIEFLDDSNPVAIDKVKNLEKYLDYMAIVAIGNPQTRKVLFEKVNSINLNLATLIHPRAYIARSAIVEEGCIVEACSVINSNTIIRRGSLICAGSVVNHNCDIGEFCHIDVNATVKSNTVVENMIKVEAGTAVS